MASRGHALGLGASGAPVEPSRKGPGLDVWELRFVADAAERAGRMGRPVPWAAIARQLDRCETDVRRNCDPVFGLDAAARGRVEAAALAAHPHVAGAAPPPRPSPQLPDSKHGPIAVASASGPAARGGATRRLVLTGWERQALAALGVKAPTAAGRLLARMAAARPVTWGVTLTDAAALGVEAGGKPYSNDTLATQISALRAGLRRAAGLDAPIETRGRRVSLTPEAAGWLQRELGGKP